MKFADQNRLFAEQNKALEDEKRALEEKHGELRARLQAAGGARKTLSPVVSSILAKSGIEVGDEVDSAVLDAALKSLSIEQRVAVKSQMARAGLIG